MLATLSGEVAIKGAGTRSFWVRELVKNVAATVPLKSWRVVGGYIEMEVDGDPSPLSRVFGLASYAPAVQFQYSDLDDLVRKAEPLAAEAVRGRTFAVRARREGEGRFTSLDVERALGAALAKYARRVDLTSPEAEVHVLVRSGTAYLFTNPARGARGIPVGVAGKTVALVSGGFDSPVAAWLMMKRGVVPVVLNLLLGPRSYVEQVLAEVQVLRQWSGAHDIRVYFVNGFDVLKGLSEVRQSLRVVVLKRVMYRLAEALARRVGAHSITTGESLSQVSSQTMWNLEAEEAGISLPVLRPLIGMDKDEIMELARRVGTYSISEKVPEYCAVAQSSKTMATPGEVDDAERALGLDYARMVAEAEVYVVARDGVRRRAARGAQEGGASA